MKKVRRALISVWDKAGLIPFVQGLRKLGIQIISTGGTAKLLKEQGIPVKEIAEFTGSPEMLGGRVKTLHPKVHGGILARREDREHLNQVKRLGLELIDLVVVNLYPFEATAAKRGVSLPELIEQIDIGGVALIRSAAKNFQSVGVVSRPSQYDTVLRELQRGGGRLSEATRLKLAVEAFTETAYYDSVIHQTLAHRAPSKGAAAAFPEKMILGASRRQLLRYGENPHQSGSWYQWSSISDRRDGFSQAKQLHGKELSFNNLLDLDAALQLAAAFTKPCAVIVKHMNPCGAACAGSLSAAFQRAFACDPLSAFGGIVGLNRPVDRAAAKAIAAAGFLECLIAPGYKADALKILRSKKNLRILQIPSSAFRRQERCMEMKQIGGGFLVQQPDNALSGPSRWRPATGFKPTIHQRRDLEFAWIVSKFVRSNAIVLAKGERTVGIGAGQASRVESVLSALKKAGVRAKGAVLASDGFFPKPDGPAAAVKVGIRAIVQPGGSIQDPEVIKVAQKARIPMYLTGERHFRH
ncbi:MAG: bifunctional phosphoribosylaminoimidazolecarboxamide formyltransferase/IMP cyclohydrolase [Candidatus Omnitrophica bacterium]|nr:bifunctional phosphoribosylaminoimidazolecarboxamide formyltransferase/IMP cyclohydrolase [Candidatus Omnitrophota bacterium]